MVKNNRKFTIWLLFLLSTLLQYSCSKTPIYIGGFFPMQDGLWDGSGILPAAEMAIADVNNDPGILVDYELRMVWNNSKCDHGATIRSLLHQIYSEPNKIMILGAGCSSQTSTIAETVSTWNLVQVSHASSSPDLDNRQKYPLLFRVHPSEKVTNNARVHIMKTFGWKRAALLYTADGSFNSIMTDLQRVFEENNITVIVSETFSSDPRQALQNIKRKDGRIIVAAAFEDNARRIICQAYNLDMTSSIYTWMFPGWYTDNWWTVKDTVCDQQTMESAVAGYIGFDVSSLSDLDGKTNVSKTARQFKEAYNNLTQNGQYGGMEYAPYGYDSAWVIAHALNDVANILNQSGRSLTNFTYDSTDIADLIFSSVNATNITGVTGNILFDFNGMRIGNTIIHQLQDNKKVVVMTHDDSKGALAGNINAFRWKTNDGDPPADGSLVIKRWTTINRPLFYVVSVFAVIGNLYVFYIFAMNIRFRKRK